MADETNKLDLVWGVDNIAKEIGVNERQMLHMLNKGAIPDAQKINGRWVIARSLLRKRFKLVA